jgi:arabinan endo-1,5-alpha-L-arabinosidase
MRSIISSSLLMLFAASSANAYSDPMTCSGTCTNAHDPALIRRDDGTYFRFSTGGKIAIHSAPAITGPWTYRGAAVPAGSIINKAGKDDLWAPDVAKVGDTYYLYYSVSSFGVQDSAIGVATSTTLDVNSWTDLGSTGISSSSSKNYNAIDGNLLIDGSNYYMQFGSFWGDLFQVKMASPPKKVASGSASTNIAYVPTGEHAQEAAFLYKYGSYYYLFFSVGKCCGYDASRPATGAEYKIKVCRSSSPTGGFVSYSSMNLQDVDVLMTYRSIKTVSRAQAAEVPQSSSPTGGSMALVVRVSSMIRPSAPCCTTTTLTRALAMLTARSNLVSTSLASLVDGQLRRGLNEISPPHAQSISLFYEPRGLFSILCLY